MRHVELKLLESLLECDGLVCRRRGLDNELEDVACFPVLGLMRIRRGAQGFLGGLVGQVATSQAPHVPQGYVGAHGLDVEATARCPISNARKPDPVLCQRRPENGEEDFVGFLAP